MEFYGTNGINNKIFAPLTPLIPLMFLLNGAKKKSCKILYYKLLQFLLFF